ncbi:MAG: DUF2460 domain-containing protein [Gammaproteobacteria bacterium]
MTDFAEVRLENNLVLYGSVGGPQYSTDVVVVRSGHEKRNVNWSRSRGRWEMGERQVDTRELQAIIGFFRARRAQGFRWKDWADYRATRTPVEHNGVTTQGLLGDGVASGGNFYQLNKLYDSGGVSELRKILKPVSGTVEIYKNGDLITSGFTIDYTNGLVTFSAVQNPPDTLTWIGEFDVPVRFDSDELRSRFDAYRAEDGESLHFILSLPVVELRVANIDAADSGNGF